LSHSQSIFPPMWTPGNDDIMNQQEFGASLTAGLLSEL
jgi:hypothetical protein